MSTVFEGGFVDRGTPAEKANILDRLVSDGLKQEVRDIDRQGYDISFGDTYDEAYSDPERLLKVYEQLDEQQSEYARRMGKFDLAFEATARTVRFGAPAAGIRDWAKRRLAVREEKAEELRSSILYDRLDVQGMPWHEQGGKALALGTIVDAHDLNAVTEYGHIYETMSGRLDDSIVSDTFADNTGWLAGLTLEQAIIAAEMKFKSKSHESARNTAARELERLREFVEAPVVGGFKDIVAYCTDALGIRSRKEEVRRAINEYAEENQNEDLLMMSVGCGTALPMLEVMQDLKTKRRSSKLILLDQDPIALAAAQQFAKQLGLEDDIEIHCEQLFHGKARKTHLLDLNTVLQDRKLDVCEDSGLREYFPDFLYKDLTQQAWGSLKDGGMMTTGNMNKNRPQPQFLHGLMGWPIPVQMRKVSDVAKLHRDAGVPKDASRLRITQDGVYTLCFSKK